MRKPKDLPERRQAEWAAQQGGVQRVRACVRAGVHWGNESAQGMTHI